MENLTSPTPVNILHLEDDLTDHLLVAEILRGDGMECKFTLVKSKEEFIQVLRGEKFDLIISDYSLPSYDGLSALATAQESQQETPFIFFSGTIGEDVAVDSLRNGAVDYVLKQRPNRLVAAVHRALRNARERATLRAAEGKIREQAALLNRAQDGIMVCNLDHEIIFWNQGAERIYGWTEAEAMGKNVRELFFQGNPPAQLATANRSLEERGEWTGELSVATKDARTITVQTRCTLIRDDEGRPKSLLFIHTDITEHKLLEEQFLRAQRLESLGVLVSGIAHDLNNTLLPIMIGVEILKMQPLSEDASSMVHTMEASAKRSADMVKQMLLFARGGETNKTYIAPGQLVQEMARLVSDTFPKSIRCQVHTEKNVHTIYGIPTQIHQVLMNLCVNARDAMNDTGMLTLAVENAELNTATPGLPIGVPPGNYVCISVADSGAGIPPDQLEKIFQPFFTTKAPGKGTGLGLSTCQSILKNHEGFIAVHSTLNVGTEFKVYFPAVRKEGAAGIASPNPLPPGGCGECILVVDDEESILAITRTALENYGYKVLTAATGMEAVACLRENAARVQLVITDHALPFMEGSVLIAALRKVRSDVKIIVAGGAEAETTGKLKEFGIAGFIPKPITTERLLSLTHQTLAGKPRPSFN